MNVKYGYVNFWRDSIPASCSWFFRGLCYTTFKLKPSLRINSINPGQTSLLNHPWCLEVPLSLSPTYFNIYLDLDSLLVSDFCTNGTWDFHKLGLLFGDCLDYFIPNLGIIDASNNNYWIWSPKPLNCSLLATVYQYLNSFHCRTDGWIVWKKLWNLNVAPHVKHFLWLTFKGRVNTFDYLYFINLGPRNLCVMCNLEHESIEHLLFSYCMAQDIWSHVSSKLNVLVSFPNGFCSGGWLTGASVPPFVKAIIAFTAWYIWKNRCDKFFWNSSVSGQVIASRAIAHTKDFLILMLISLECVLSSTTSL